MSRTRRRLLLRNQTPFAFRLQPWSVVLLSLLLANLGCSGRLPAVKPPRIDVSAASVGAIEQFDADGDGQVSQSEACQGIQAQWSRYDVDEDGFINQSEFQQRFQRWTDGDTGLMNLRAQVTYRGQPLTDASISMTPYVFLGPNVLAAEGVTDAYGYAFMAIPKENLPKSQQTNFGMQVGLYQVSINHPALANAKAEANSTLSVDLSFNEANTGVTFHLK